MLLIRQQGRILYFQNGKYLVPQVLMIGEMSISEQNVSVIGEFVRLDMSAEYAYQVPSKCLHG